MLPDPKSWLRRAAKLPRRTNAAGPAPATGRQVRKVFILAGQSNMCGRAAVGSAPAYRHGDRLFVYTKAGAWEQGRDPVDAFEGQVDSVSHDHRAGFGPALPFADALAARLPGLEIGLVPCAKGGTSIDKWQRHGSRGTLYGSMIARAGEASAAGELAGLIWYQGEADTVSASLTQSWPEKFTTLVADIRRDLDRPRLPVVMTVLGPGRAPSRYRFWEELAGLQGRMVLPAHVVRVSARDLEGKENDAHLTAGDYIELGRRYAAAMEKILNGEKA